MGRQRTFTQRYQALSTAAERAAVRLSRGVAEQQSELLHAGIQPDGSPQRENTVRTTKAKQGRPPLVDTGTFADTANWRITVLEDEVTLRAPASRSGFLRIWRAWGFTTIFDELPAGVAEKWDEYLAEEDARG